MHNKKCWAAVVAAIGSLFLFHTSADAGYVGYEDLTLGTLYHFNDSEIYGGEGLQCDTFYWSDGAPTTDGFSGIDNCGLTGGSDQELWVDNLTCGTVPGAGTLSMLCLAYLCALRRPR